MLDEELRPHKEKFISKLKTRVPAFKINSLLRKDDEERQSVESEMESEYERIAPYSSNNLSVRQLAENVPMSVH